MILTLNRAFQKLSAINNIVFKDFNVSNVTDIEYFVSGSSEVKLSNLESLKFDSLKSFKQINDAPSDLIKNLKEYKYIFDYLNKEVERGVM